MEILETISSFQLLATVQELEMQDQMEILLVVVAPMETILETLW